MKNKNKRFLGCQLSIWVNVLGVGQLDPPHLVGLSGALGGVQREAVVAVERRAELRGGGEFPPGRKRYKLKI